ncbi:MAG TPA: pyridoxamine 5'-phosphate oxidase family protein [Acidimicrobiia bacterium]|nr:pyridoxamine 5'-phosphate oxidase family protein [Acidimicrobiia bacterium]
MARWRDIKGEAPELAARVQARFDAHRHKVLATLRADGSPRLSGIETRFTDGDLWLGMMPQSRKALDLRRDPRLSLHSATVDPKMADGDARVSGRAEEVFDPDRFAEVFPSEGGEQGPPGDPHLFRVEVTEVVLVTIGDPADHLLIEAWHPGRGVQRTERR